MFLSFASDFHGGYHNAFCLPSPSNSGWFNAPSESVEGVKEDWNLIHGPFEEELVRVSYELAVEKAVAGVKDTYTSIVSGLDLSLCINDEAVVKYFEVHKYCS
jgi:hypothetical protein